VSVQHAKTISGLWYRKFLYFLCFVSEMPFSNTKKKKKKNTRLEVTYEYKVISEIKSYFFRFSQRKFSVLNKFGAVLSFSRLIHSGIGNGITVSDLKKEERENEGEVNGGRLEILYLGRRAEGL
jgi:hypothetical protein